MSDVGRHSGMSLTATFDLGLSGRLLQLTAVVLLVHASAIG